VFLAVFHTSTTHSVVVKAALQTHSTAAHVATKGLKIMFPTLWYHFHLVQASTKTSFIACHVLLITFKILFGTFTTVSIVSVPEFKAVPSTLGHVAKVFNILFQAFLALSHMNILHYK
jgi:hypothetical protein